MILHFFTSLSLPKGKHIFGTVKVGERGQIVIPKADVMKDIAVRILKGLGGLNNDE